MIVWGAASVFESGVFWKGEEGSAAALCRGNDSRSLFGHSSPRARVVS